MKRVILTFLLLSSIFIVSFSDEIPIFIGNGYNFNETIGGMVDDQFAIKYDTEDDQYYFFCSDFITKGWIYLSNDDITRLRNTIAKYFEWEKTALEKQVEIEKEIPDSTINGEISFLYGDSWHSARSVGLVFYFFSQTVTEHQLVIIPQKVRSSKNEYIDFNVPALYLTHDQIQAFQVGISEANIEEKMKAFEEKKSAEDLFH